MLCENYTSDLLPYTLGGPDDGYSASIPAGYDERINSGLVLGLFFEADSTTTGRVVFMSWMDVRHFPGWSVSAWAWNADTGALISEETFGSGGPLSSAEISQGANDELYGEALIGGAIYRLAPKTYEQMADPPILQSDFGAVVIDCFTIDLGRDLMVMHSDLEIYQLGVYKLSDGSLVRRISLPDRPAAVCHAGGSRVYVLLRNKLLVSLDYTTGQIYQCTLLPAIGDPLNAKVAYDRRFQRLLVVEYTADNPDGSSTIRVHGFRNRPQGVHVCKPIPLKRLRADVKSPVLHKLIGDAGEGIVGMVSTSATDVNAHVVRSLAPLDGDGEAVVDVLGLAEGADTITATAEVECLL